VGISVPAAQVTRELLAAIFKEPEFTIGSSGSTLRTHILTH
jgi:hypothetical protein